MSDHDKFCPADTPLGGGCECEVIAAIRADEREKAGNRVAAEYERVKRRLEVVWSARYREGLSNGFDLAETAARGDGPHE